MAAALNTTERGPKTTKATKAAALPPGVMGLPYWQAKYSAEVDAEHAAACAASLAYPTLRQLVDAWLPLRRADAELAARHTDLEERHSDADTTNAAEDVWQEACAATAEARNRVLMHPAASASEALAKTETFFAMSERPCLEAQDGEGEPNALVESLIRDLTSQTTAHRAEVGAWESALAAYRAAAAAVGRGDERRRFAPGSAWRAMFADAPTEILRGAIEYPLHLRWHRAECVLSDFRVEPSERARLAALVDEWAPVIIRRINEMPDDYPGDDALDDAFSDAEEALFSMPAPTVEAALLKAELIERALDDDGYGFDDLGHVCYKKNSHFDHRRTVWQFIDLLNATKTDHPILDMEPFVPAAWIAAFEAAGGIVSCPALDDSVLILTRGNRDARRALDEISKTEWKLRAVFYQAQSRRVGGGDPLVDHAAQHGSADCRGGKAERMAKVRGPLGPGVSVSFTHRDGAIAAIVERVNLTWGLQ